MPVPVCLNQEKLIFHVRDTINHIHQHLVVRWHLPTHKWPLVVFTAPGLCSVLLHDGCGLILPVGFAFVLGPASGETPSATSPDEGLVGSRVTGQYGAQERQERAQSQ